MKTRRSPKPGTSHTISCTDEQWDDIRAGAARARKRVSPWFVECALNVELSPKRAVARPLVLDAREQRFIARAVGELARGARSADDASRDPGGAIRALLRDGIGELVQRRGRNEAIGLLRLVFGDDRAEVIAAAFVADVPTTSESPEGAEEDGFEDRPARDPSGQGELF